MELDSSILIFLLIGAVVLMAVVGAIMKIFWKVAGVLVLFALLAFVFTGATPSDLWKQADKISNGTVTEAKNKFGCPKDGAVLIQKISDQQMRVSQINQQLRKVPQKSEAASKLRGQLVIVNSELKRLHFCQERLSVG